MNASGKQLSNLKAGNALQKDEEESKETYKRHDGHQIQVVDVPFETVPLVLHSGKLYSTTVLLVVAKGTTYVRTVVVDSLILQKGSASKVMLDFPYTHDSTPFHKKVP